MLEENSDSTTETGKDENSAESSDNLEQEMKPKEGRFFSLDISNKMQNL